MENKDWCQLGIDLRDHGRYQEALDSFNKAVALTPRDELAWMHRATVLALLGRHEQAVHSCDKAIKIWAGESIVWLVRGESLTALGRLQEAVKNYEQAQRCCGKICDFREERTKAVYALEDWLEERLPARRPPDPFVALYKLVGPSEERLHLFIRQKLQRHYGKEETQWWKIGVPEGIRQECAKRREYDLRGECYGYTSLIDLKEILKHNWRVFEEDFQRIKDQIGSKNDFLDALRRFNDIRKLVMHPVRNQPSEDDYRFAQSVHDMIVKFAGPG